MTPVMKRATPGGRRAGRGRGRRPWPGGRLRCHWRYAQLAGKPARVSRPAGGEVETNYLTITLGNARVAAVGESSAGERPAETVSFAATKVNVSYTAQHPDGSPARTETFCFNFASQRTC
jgi:hypothetical protein